MPSPPADARENDMRLTEAVEYYSGRAGWTKDNIKKRGTHFTPSRPPTPDKPPAAAGA